MTSITCLIDRDAQELSKTPLIVLIGQVIEKIRPLSSYFIVILFELCVALVQPKSKEVVRPTKYDFSGVCEEVTS